MLRAIICRLFPGLGARIEAESRTWFLQCPECGHEISVWDAGGVRYRARGNPRRLMRCGGCGTSSWHKVYRKVADEA